MRRDKITSVAIAIINYNTREHLRACIKSVLSEDPHEVVIVDNISTDGSVDMVRAEFPQVMVYVNKVNSGYGAAANQAVASCTSKYILLLNSDTLLLPRTLHTLSRYLDLNPRAGIVGPRLINPDGTLQASCFPFPTPIDMVIEESGLRRWIQRVPSLRDRYLRTWSHSYDRIVPWVKGAALLIRRDAFDAVGGFDELFFMYFEEADLCYRMQAAGWQIHFSPAATICHIGGASTERFRAEMMIKLYASTMRFYQQHYSKLRLIELRAVVKILMLLRLVRDVFRLKLINNVQKHSVIAEDIAIWRRLFLSQL